MASDCDRESKITGSKIHGTNPKAEVRRLDVCDKYGISTGKKRSKMPGADDDDYDPNNRLVGKLYFHFCLASTYKQK